MIRIYAREFLSAIPRLRVLEIFEFLCASGDASAFEVFKDALASSIAREISAQRRSIAIKKHKVRRLADFVLAADATPNVKLLALISNGLLRPAGELSCDTN
jgi:Mg/Co/Ni transporter MgtE